MFTQLFRNWWRLAVRGVLAILFGVLALIRPASTTLVLVLLFGAFAFVDGIFAVTTGIAARGYLERWWAILLEGMAGILIGVLTFFLPNITALVMLYFIAAWAVTTGILEIVAAIEFRQVISGEWGMILAGLLSVLLGILLFVFPGVGMLGVVWMIGVYAIAAGIMEMVFAYRLRGPRQKLGITGAARA